jgi:hypothetical protein
MCCWNVATYEWKVHNGKIEIISLVVVSFLTTTHCQFRGAGQGMKQTYLYLWYPLFQVLKKNEKKLARSFNFTFRYIDDVPSLNNSRFGDFVDRIELVRVG